MLKTEFKLQIQNINQILPSPHHIHKIYPLTQKPKNWNNLNTLNRNLKIQDRIYFQLNNNWYELTCQKSMNIW